MSISALIIDVLVCLIQRTSWLGVFLAMVMESACIPMPSEIVMPLAGFALCNNLYEVLFGTLIGALANLSGSWLAYVAGRWGGRRLIYRYGKRLILRRSEYQHAEKFFMRYGDIAILTGRLLPAIRTFISLPAGIFSMNPLRFTLYTILGSLPWNFVLVYLGYVLGEQWRIIEGYMIYLDVIVVIFLTIFTAFIILKWRQEGRRGAKGTPASFKPSSGQSAGRGHHSNRVLKR